MEDAVARARAQADAMWEGDAASRSLGIEVVEVAPGRAVVTMTVGPSMVNGHGICHGGFIFALADSAFAYACNSRGERAVASGGSIAYLRPGRVGERLVAVAHERARAGRSGLYDVRVSAPDGGVVAEFRGQSRVIGSFFPPS